ncbi:MAG: tandem-95 repeat protein, partial [Gammaproteobacteria bacterium]
GETLTDTITVTSDDGTTQDITITITGTNDDPTAVADSLTTSENENLTIEVSDLTDNDFDVEGDAFNLTDIDSSSTTGDLSMLYNMGEVGQVDLSSSTTIEFSSSFTNPVVFAFVNTENGSDPVIARVDNVTQSSFDLSLIEADNMDGVHTTETVSYIVLEEGIWELPDGSKIEIGTYDTSNVIGSSSDFESVSFSNDFDESPIVFSQIQTSNNNVDFIKTRQKTPNSDEMDIGIERSESNSSDLSLDESIAYFAIEESSGSWAGHNFVVGNTSDSVTHSNYTQNFAVDLGVGDINMIGQLATFDGPNDASLRGVGTTSTSTQFNVEEDTTQDSETSHTTEIANFFAIAGSGLLTAELISSPTAIPDSQISSIEYDPGDNFDYLAVGETATDTFTYTITDEHGATDTETVTITITGTNDTPVAVADTATTLENASLTIDVLANDTDLDTSDSLSIASATIVGDDNGSVLIDNNELVFNPGSDFDDLAVGESRDITINYTIEDGNGGSDSSTVTITVIGTNDAPVAVADTATTSENTSLPIEVLANDTDIDTGDNLSIESASIIGSNNGSVTIIDNELVFNPGFDFDDLAVNESRNITINYTIEDNNGAQSTASVTVTVTGTNDTPTAVIDTTTTTADSSITIDVLANDTDPDTNDTLTIISATIDDLGGSDGDDDDDDDDSGNNASVSITNGELVFDPGDDFNHLAYGETQDVTISYIIEDNHGAQSTSTVTVTVTGVNYDPVAINDTYTSTGYSAVIDVLANDYDPNGSTLTITSATVTGDLEGTIEIINNQIVYIPDFDDQTSNYYNMIYYAFPENANTTINYTIENDQGYQDTANVDISLTDLGYYLIITDNYSNSSFSLSNEGDYVRMDGNDDFTLYGNGGNDVLIGDRGDYTFYGGAGDDYLEGGREKDELYGGDGDDILIGGKDKDTLDGGAGDDYLDGGDKDDIILGGSGDDYIIGGSGKDTIDGGSGTDTLSYADASKGITVDLSDGSGSKGDAKGDTITNIENVTGSSKDDTITGDDNDNIIIGGAGDDTVYGLGGEDTYIYQAGDDDDSFHGGTGNWTDTIELQGIDSAPNSGDWTLTVTNNANFTVDSETNTVVFDSSASGSIVLNSGEELDFDEIEKIVWTS